MIWLVVLHRIIFCEGKVDKSDKGFDTKCYNKIFSEEFPDTLFISREISTDVIRFRTLETDHKAELLTTKIIKRKTEYSQKKRINISNNGIGYPEMLAMVFIVLKLTGEIDWS